jgi:hypothetical protein
MSSALMTSKQPVFVQIGTSDLADTDWTQVADAQVDKAVWATYRQALRDVPAQAGFPHDVTWPDQPE